MKEVRFERARLLRRVQTYMLLVEDDVDPQHFLTDHLAEFDVDLIGNGTFEGEVDYETHYPVEIGVLEPEPEPVEVTAQIIEFPLKGQTDG